MTHIIRITIQEEDALHERFAELFSRVKPIMYDAECINILKRTKKPISCHKMVVKHKGDKHEKYYRNRRFQDESDCIKHLERYIQIKGL